MKFISFTEMQRTFQVKVHIILKHKIKSPIYIVCSRSPLVKPTILTVEVCQYLLKTHLYIIKKCSILNQNLALLICHHKLVKSRFKILRNLFQTRSNYCTVYYYTNIGTFLKLPYSTYATHLQRFTCNFQFVSPVVSIAYNEYKIY